MERRCMLWSAAGTVTVLVLYHLIFRQGSHIPGLIGENTAMAAQMGDDRSIISPMNGVNCKQRAEPARASRGAIHKIVASGLGLQGNLGDLKQAAHHPLSNTHRALSQVKVRRLAR